MTAPNLYFSYLTFCDSRNIMILRCESAPALDYLLPASVKLFLSIIIRIIIEFI